MAERRASVTAARLPALFIAAFRRRKFDLGRFGYVVGLAFPKAVEPAKMVGNVVADAGFAVRFLSIRKILARAPRVLFYAAL